MEKQLQLLLSKTSERQFIAQRFQASTSYRAPTGSINLTGIYLGITESRSKSTSTIADAQKGGSSGGGGGGGNGLGTFAQFKIRVDNIDMLARKGTPAPADDGNVHYRVLDAHTIEIPSYEKGPSETKGARKERLKREDTLRAEVSEKAKQEFLNSRTNDGDVDPSDADVPEQAEIDAYVRDAVNKAIPPRQPVEWFRVQQGQVLSYVQTWNKTQLNGVNVMSPIQIQGVTCKSNYYAEKGRWYTNITASNIVNRSNPHADILGNVCQGTFDAGKTPIPIIHSPNGGVEVLSTQRNIYAFSNRVVADPFDGQDGVKCTTLLYPETPESYTNKKDEWVKPRLFAPLTIYQQQQVNGSLQNVNISCKFYEADWSDQQNQNVLRSTIGISDPGIFGKIMAANKIPFIFSGSIWKKNTLELGDVDGSGDLNVIMFANDATFLIGKYLVESCGQVSAAWVKQRLVDDPDFDQDNYQNLDMRHENGINLLNHKNAKGSGKKRVIKGPVNLTEWDTTTSVFFQEDDDDEPLFEFRVLDDAPLNIAERFHLASQDTETTEAYFNGAKGLRIEGLPKKYTKTCYQIYAIPRTYVQSVRRTTDRLNASSPINAETGDLMVDDATILAMEAAEQQQQHQSPIAEPMDIDEEDSSLLDIEQGKKEEEEVEPSPPTKTKKKRKKKPTAETTGSGESNTKKRKKKSKKR